MSKKAAVLAVNPVNGSGLFQYLEAFYENGISYEVFAVAETSDIKTNSGFAIKTNDTIANLVGRENEFDALVFACGDAIPNLNETINEKYHQQMLAVVKAFADKEKIMIGHCAAALIYEFAGVSDGKNLAIHPLAKAAVQKGIASDENYVIDRNYYTAQSENYIGTMIDKVVSALK